MKNFIKFSETRFRTRQTRFHQHKKAISSQKPVVRGRGFFHKRRDAPPRTTLHLPPITTRRRHRANAHRVAIPKLCTVGILANSRRPFASSCIAPSTAPPPICQESPHRPTDLGLGPVSSFCVSAPLWEKPSRAAGPRHLSFLRNIFLKQPGSRIA